MQWDLSTHRKDTLCRAGRCWIAWPTGAVSHHSLLEILDTHTFANVSGFGKLAIGLCCLHGSCSQYAHGEDSVQGMRTIVTDSLDDLILSNNACSNLHG